MTKKNVMYAVKATVIEVSKRPDEDITDFSCRKGRELGSFWYGPVGHTKAEAILLSDFSAAHTRAPRAERLEYFRNLNIRHLKLTVETFKSTGEIEQANLGELK
jgi:hypothetical protein